jgi:PIH1 N-terminal domain
MEKDNNDSNVACFDCCYHPLAVAQMDVVKKFRDSLVHTAIEGVEEAYRAQKQEVKMLITLTLLSRFSFLVSHGIIPMLIP